MRMKTRFDPVGIIGFGLMGQGIASCLLAHRDSICVYDRNRRTQKKGLAHIEEALSELARRKLVRSSVRTKWRERIVFASEPADLAPCRFVIESVEEDLQLKQKVFSEVEPILSREAIITSNTSSLPISVLQSPLRFPQRMAGMHWGEPADIMRYLEIIPGKQTSTRTIASTYELGIACGKDPTVLREDIQGFLSNRMMYAMLREACYLVENGIADIETVDRSFRNDIGWWATLAGPFRWMDLTGIPAYAAVMKGLLPKLSKQTTIPRTMRAMVARGARGVSNRKGFYKYSRAEARRWQKAWVDFTYEIAAIASKYEKIAP
jgi:3-hydroxybutyryl-CoA dehydrogenase